MAKTSNRLHRLQNRERYDKKAFFTQGVATSDDRNYDAAFGHPLYIMAAIATAGELAEKRDFAGDSTRIL
jgi:hypothetical protein